MRGNVQSLKDNTVPIQKLLQSIKKLVSLMEVSKKGEFKIFRLGVFEGNKNKFNLIKSMQISFWN